MSTVQPVPMWRLTDRMVRSGLVMAWRLATSPTSTSPDLAKPTTDGVVRPPSAFGMTTGSPPSSTETTELVVPRSIPTALAIVLPPTPSPSAGPGACCCFSDWTCSGYCTCMRPLLGPQVPPGTIDFCGCAAGPTTWNCLERCRAFISRDNYSKLECGCCKFLAPF